MNKRLLYNSSNLASPRYLFIDALRGLACLAVVFYHAKEGGHIDALYAAIPFWMAQFFDHGDSGVSVFFVISGFVIANSMAQEAVSASYIARFLLRRSLRLDPPYWTAIILSLFAAFISVHFVPGKVFVFPSLGNVLLHVAYLVDLAQAPLINSVFWTLCIEIQFYFSFAIMMWLVTVLTPYMERNKALDLVLWPSAALAVLWMTPYAPIEIHGLFLSHWYLFLAGVLTWRAVDKSNDKQSLAAALSYLIFLGLSVVIFAGKWNEVIGLTAASILLIIGYIGGLKTISGGSSLQWLGLISYSLYLTHNPITGAGFRIGYMLTGRSLATEILWLVIVIIACCIFAWIFFLVIERPSIGWSKKIQLHPGEIKNQALIRSTIS